MSQKLARNLGILLIPVIIVLFSTDIVVLNEKVYPRLFEKYKVYTTINASQETINNQAINLMNYLQDQEPLQPALLNEKEVQHMADVKQLFTRGYQLLVISVLAGISCLILSRERRNMIRYGSLLTIISIVSAAVIDFSTVFYQFHILFFDNNLWLLNPATDNLIKMYPQQLSQELATRIGFLAVGMASIGLAITLYKPRKKAEV